MFEKVKVTSEVINKEVLETVPVKSKRFQGKPKGVAPHKKNQTSFSSTYQPSGAAKAAGQKRNRELETQAQEAMNNAQYNPMEKMIAVANQYELMIANKVSWDGMTPASNNEIANFVKALTKINETLIGYQSAKAPVRQVSAEIPKNESSKVDDSAPLSVKDLMTAQRNMVANLEERL